MNCKVIWCIHLPLKAVQIYLNNYILDEGSWETHLLLCVGSLHSMLPINLRRPSHTKGEDMIVYVFTSPNVN